MIPTKFEVRDRGATPRGMRKVMNAVTKETWFETGVEFHAYFTKARFTHAHATKAGYAQRSRNYERRKLKKFKHTNPLEFSGTTKRLVRDANITSTSKGVSVRYPGARAFNYKNPKMRANMVEEFTKVLPEEANELASFFDRSLDRKLNAYNGAN